MSEERALASPTAAVLFVDDDRFESDYVETRLAPLGVEVVRLEPGCQSLSAALLARLRAAVIACQTSDNPRQKLIDALEQSRIPCLQLIEAAGNVAEGRPVLERPFAAYQVADWVLGAVGEPAANIPGEGSTPGD